jgi:hypothetical protein
LIYVDARLFKFSKTNLDATAAILPVLSNTGRVRIDTNASYYIKLISNLKWNISFMATGVTSRRKVSLEVSMASVLG